MNTSFDFMWMPFLCGVSFGCALSLVFSLQLPKQTEIVISSDHKNISYQSNGNKEGDRYIIIVGKDTIGQGVIENGIWVGGK